MSCPGSFIRIASPEPVSTRRCDSYEAAWTGHVDAWRMYKETFQTIVRGSRFVQGHTYRRNWVRVYTGLFSFFVFKFANEKRIPFSFFVFKSEVRKTKNEFVFRFSFLHLGWFCRTATSGGRQTLVVSAGYFGRIGCVLKTNSQKLHRRSGISKYL